MTYGLVILLALTFIAAIWARSLAERRGRHAGRWSFATVMFPPVVLILWALPPKPAT